MVKSDAILSSSVQSDPDRTASRASRRSPKSRDHRRWWPVLTAIFVVVIGLSLLIPWSRHQWVLSLVRQPTRYTALSFVHPTSLPYEAELNQTIRFSFSIANYEGHSVDYRYSVATSPTHEPQAPDVSHVRLSNDQRASIPISVPLACDASPCRIRVSLAGYTQSIDFLVAYPRAADASNG